MFTCWVVLAEHGRPEPAIAHPVVMLHCGPLNLPFAASAKSEIG
jgi:hypothetical protein